MTVINKLNGPIVYFSQLQGLPVFIRKGKRLGRFTDFFVNYEEVYPSVFAIGFKHKQNYYYVLWEDLELINKNYFQLKEHAQIRFGRSFPKTLKENNNVFKHFSAPTVDYPGLAKIILDKQIVDISGRKVVRVNDLKLVKVGNNLKVTHVTVGPRSLIRRLDLEKTVDTFVKVFFKNSSYLKMEKSINWKFVHALPDKNIQKNVKINMLGKELKDIHPADLADILEDLDSGSRDLIFQDLDEETKAATLSEIDESMRNIILKNEEKENAAKIIENMGTDNAADVLAELSHDERKEIIEKIEDQEIKEEINELLFYEENSAGGVMSTEYLYISSNDTKENVLKLIKNKNDDYETVYDIFVIDSKDKLQGTISLRKVLGLDSDDKISKFMNSHDIKSVPPDWSWKEVAKYMNKYNLINVPVCKDEKILGIISIDDILQRLLEG